METYLRISDLVQLVRLLSNAALALREGLPDLTGSLHQAVRPFSPT